MRNVWPDNRALGLLTMIALTDEMIELGTHPPTDDRSIAKMVCNMFRADSELPNTLADAEAGLTEMREARRDEQAASADELDSLAIAMLLQARAVLFEAAAQGLRSIATPDDDLEVMRYMGPWNEPEWAAMTRLHRVILKSAHSLNGPTSDDARAEFAALWQRITKI